MACRVLIVLQPPHARSARRTLTGTHFYQLETVGSRNGGRLPGFTPGGRMDASGGRFTAEVGNGLVGVSRRHGGTRFRLRAERADSEPGCEDDRQSCRDQGPNNEFGGSGPCE